MGGGANGISGLETALKTRDQLRRLHCRLAGFTDRDQVATQRCLKDTGTEKEDGEEEQEEEEAVDQEAVAEEALREFFAPFQERLLAMVEAIGDARERRVPGDTTDGEKKGETDQTGESLRDFYLA